MWINAWSMTDRPHWLIASLHKNVIRQRWQQVHEIWKSATTIQGFAIDACTLSYVMRNSLHPTCPARGNGFYMRFGCAEEKLLSFYLHADIKIIDVKRILCGTHTDKTHTKNLMDSTVAEML
jgi:hypothetical protein